MGLVLAPLELSAEKVFYRALTKLPLPRPSLSPSYNRHGVSHYLRPRDCDGEGAYSESHIDNRDARVGNLVRHRWVVEADSPAMYRCMFDMPSDAQVKKRHPDYKKS